MNKQCGAILTYCWNRVGLQYLSRYIRKDTMFS